MSQKSRESFIGPYTMFLVRNIESILGHLNSLNYIQALISTYNFILFLDPNVKNSDKVKEFMKTANEIFAESKGVGGIGAGQMSRNRHKYMETRASEIMPGMIDEIITKLHEAGYFWWDKKYGLSEEELNSLGSIEI